MIIYRVLSALLSYPEQELIDALPEIDGSPGAHAAHPCAAGAAP